MPMRNHSLVLRTLAMCVACLLFAGCYSHECDKGARRCNAGELQHCDCKKKITGIYFSGTCLEATRWHPVRDVIGCIDTPDGPRGSRESCAASDMPAHCDQGRPATCARAANGQTLLFTDYCVAPQTCQIDADNTPVCREPVATNLETALLLYATHPITHDGRELWAPTLLPVDVSVTMDSSGFAVFASGDQVRASRGGNVPVVRGSRVTLPRSATAEFLLYRKSSPPTVETLVSDAASALEYQAFWSRPLPNFETVVRASAITYAGDKDAAARLVRQSLNAAPVDAMLTGALQSIEQFNAGEAPDEPVVQTGKGWTLLREDGEPAEVTYEFAMSQCDAIGSLPTADEIREILPELKTLTGAYTLWSAERDGTKTQIFAVGEGRSSSGWFDLEGPRADMRRFHAICMY